MIHKCKIGGLKVELPDNTICKVIGKYENNRDVPDDVHLFLEGRNFGYLLSPRDKNKIRKLVWKR